MNEHPHTAGVAVPPPVLFGAGLGLGLLAGRLAGSAGPRFARVLGAASITAGLGIAAAAIGRFREAETAVSPFAPSTALVTGGVYERSRNPIYFALTSVYLGVALIARSIPAFVALPIVLAMLDRYVVAPEERYLEARFGDDYRTYAAAVPRWF